MDTKFKFFTAITNDIFDRLMPFCLNTILSLRKVTVTSNGVIPYVSDSTVDYTLIKPTQFQIKTSYDLLEDMKLAKEADVPSYQKSALYEDYVDKQFGGNDYLKKKTCVINQIDKLANRSFAEISTLLIAGSATNRQWQYSVSLPIILDQMNRNNGTEWFLEATIDDIKTLSWQIFDAENPILEPQVNYTEERIEA